MSMSFTEELKEIKTPTLRFSRMLDDVQSVDKYRAFMRDKKNADGLDYSYDKEEVMRIITGDKLLQKIKLSNYFYSANADYRGIINKVSGAPIFNPLLIPLFRELDPEDIDDFNADFLEKAEILQDMNIQKDLSRASLGLIKDGAYYGIAFKGERGFYLQDLPTEYCRSRARSLRKNRDLVEFNVEFFDRATPTDSSEQKTLFLQRLLKQFPKEFKEAYMAYKKDRNKKWFLVNPETSVCLKIGDGTPPYLAIIPDLITLHKNKNNQAIRDDGSIRKILTHKLPLTKDGDLVFTLDEAVDLHEATASMVKTKNPNVDVITTFGEVEMLNTDTSRSTAKDDLIKNERSVANSANMSQNMISGDGQTGALMSVQYITSLFVPIFKELSNYYTDFFDLFLPTVLWTYDILIPEMNVYNRSEKIMSAKEGSILGQSKMLENAYRGTSQVHLINLGIAETKCLNLNEILIPSASTHTGGAEVSEPSGGTADNGGRPEMNPTDKSDKTIANQK